MAHKILIVSDDRSISNALKEALVRDDHLVMISLSRIC
jgi:hypothetical protein